MASTVRAEGGSERTVMEQFGSGGLALLPWTKQMLTVLWVQLRLLLQVIYYTCMSVFQMFRFEVHVRITDETGQHIQHMSSTANPSESFLFSSLFDGDGGVMVGSSGPLSNFCGDSGDPFTGKTPAEALLSSLRADELCCGLVDDFVSRTSGIDDGLFLGHQSSWKMGFPGDWNIFVSGSDGSGAGEACHKGGEGVTSEEEKSVQWSSEDDQSAGEFDSEESKALWDSLSRSSDPYNPFFFSACISTNTSMGRRDSSETDLRSGSKAGEDGQNMWVSRSDSESSWSSDGSGPNLDEESEKLLDFFSSSDPYNPMCFTACTASSTPPQSGAKQLTSLHAPPRKSDTEKKKSSQPSSDDDEEWLWESLRLKNDPYHPLNFQALVHSSPAKAQFPPASKAPLKQNPPTKSMGCVEEVKTAKKPRFNKPRPQERAPRHHSHPNMTLVPWRRPSPTERKEKKTGTPQKKVQFSPLIHVHVMRTWPFARQASRKGHWEEMARDRDRFQRRILEAERSIGRCFFAAHRRKMWAYVNGALKSTSSNL